MDKTIKTLTEAIQLSKEGTKPYDAVAEVVRVEGDTAWCHIVGGIDETPVKMTIAAQEGDTVQVRVSGGRAWITGNQSAPPTDDKVAHVANKSAKEAKKTADDAQVTAENAEEVASKANEAARNVNQYFWHTETDTGAGAGAHITEVPKDEFLDDPDNGGGNLLARSNGVAIRNGLDEIAQFTLSPYGEALIGMNDINACTLRGNYDRNADEARSRWAVQMQNNLAALAVMTIQAYNNKAIFDISGTGSSISNNGEGDLNLYSTNFYLNHEKLTDYVIERGTSGNWKYIKWHSGRVEAEGYVTFSSLAFSQRGSLYRSGATAFTIPSGIFDTAPTEGHAWIQSGSASDYFGAVIGSLTATGGNCMVWKATSGTGSNISVHMRLIYRG